jgi:hypothetical protein
VVTVKDERRISTEFSFDRLSSQKLPQAYEILVPNQLWKLVKKDKVDNVEGERTNEDRGDLRARILGPAEGTKHDRQSDRCSKGVRAESRVHRS